MQYIQHHRPVPRPWYTRVTDEGDVCLNELGAVIWRKAHGDKDNFIPGKFAWPLGREIEAMDDERVVNEGVCGLYFFIANKNMADAFRCGRIIAPTHDRRFLIRVLWFYDGRITVAARRNAQVPVADYLAGQRPHRGRRALAVLQQPLRHAVRAHRGQPGGGSAHQAR